MPDRTVKQVFEELLEAKRRDGASRAYVAPLKTCLGHFARDFKCSIASVATSDIDAWLRGLKQSPRSRNNHRNAVVLLFNFAKTAGYLNRDRSTAAEHTALARSRAEAIEVFSPAEFAKLLMSEWKNKTGRVVTVDKLHKRVGKICEAAGVSWKDNALRHSFITYRLATTKDAVRTAFEAGNSPQIIRSNYDAVATETEGKLWFSIMPETAENVIQMKAAA